MSITKSITNRANKGREAIRKHDYYDMRAADAAEIWKAYQGREIEDYDVIMYSFYLGVLQGMRIAEQQSGE